jgi:hypothetical protein
LVATLFHLCCLIVETLCTEEQSRVCVYACVSDIIRVWGKVHIIVSHQRPRAAVSPINAIQFSMMSCSKATCVVYSRALLESLEAFTKVAWL